MRPIFRIIVVIASLGTAGAAIAASPTPFPGDGSQAIKTRFTMTPANGGFIRMDTETGVLSFCSGKSGALRCQLVPDDRAALEKDIKRLKQQNKTLREDNKRLEDMVLGLGNKPGSSSSSKRTFRLPSEEEVDKALNYVERMYKKFRDKLRELEAEKKDGRGTEL